MKEEKYYLDLDKYEHGVIIKSLSDFRNDLIEENRSTDIVDELILKTADAPKKKFKVIEKVVQNEAR